MHKRCSGFKDRLGDIPDFKSSKCNTRYTRTTRSETAKKIKLEVVDLFCYLCDMLSAGDGVGGGVEASSVMRVRSGWKKVRELLPLDVPCVFTQDKREVLCSLHQR